MANDATPTPEPLPSTELTPEQRREVAAALAPEYAVLMTSLAAVWAASLTRTSLFLGVLSAVGVALGFAVQAGGTEDGTFTVFALVVLPLALFLGLATFVRTVEIQREAIVYIAGMNRIRHLITETVPGTRRYLVLSTHDDELGIYRSQGTGIRLRVPRYRLVFALVQTQGIVAVMCAALAAAIGGLAAAAVSSVVAWVVAAVAFVATLVVLFTFWNRSIAEIREAVKPLHPMPPGELSTRL